METEDKPYGGTWPPGPYVCDVISGQQLTMGASGSPFGAFRLRIVGTDAELTWYLSNAPQAISDFGSSLHEVIPEMIGKRFVFPVQRMRWCQEWRNIVSAPIAEVVG